MTADTLDPNAPVHLDAFAYLGTEIFRYARSVRPHWYKVFACLDIDLGQRFEGVTVEIAGCPVRIVDGHLRVDKGWEFDGASGPAIDGIGNMFAALVHDALYLLKRMGATLFSFHMADGLYRDICRAQGEGRARSWMHWASLRAMGWLWRLKG